VRAFWRAKIWMQTPHNFENPAIITMLSSCRRILLFAILVSPPVMLSWLVCVVHRPTLPVNVDEIEVMGNRFARLPNGRVLEYYVCGDPDGAVLYAQHGYGSTGLCYHNPHVCDIATRLGLRIISITLPGFGLSDDLNESQKILEEWPTEMNTVLLQEGLTEEDPFYVTGESMGCVYATAVVAATNSSRILGAAFFTPPAPNSVLNELGISLPFESQLVKYLLPIPYLGDVIAYAVCYGMPVESRLKAMPDVAAALTKMERENLQEYFIKDLRHSCIRSHHGFQSHLQSMTDEWPFDLANVRSNGKILITSSPDDKTNPPKANQWFSNQIPGSKLLTMKPGWGHLHCVFPAVIESTWWEMMTKQ